MVFVIYLIIALVFGLIGSSMATSRNRSSGLWFVLCAVFGLFGIIALLLIGKNPGGGTSEASGVLLPPTANFDRTKWQVLSEVDPDIQAAIAKVAPFGDRWVSQLAEKYLAVGDKQYLDSIVSNVIGAAQSAPPGTPRGNNRQQSV
ncbi:hypothetical protein [Ciceribacter azotifigens]|uniref:hypothetical protein n=1 Tax=Ciceribacter azotifigens TaxID=2069303 RepID=UPI003A878523